MVKRKRQIRSKWNDTTIFLLPIFGIFSRRYEEAGFINAYINDTTKERNLFRAKGVIPIYLLFKPNEEQLYNLKDLYSDLEEMNLLIDEYDYDGGYTVLILSFPLEYLSDYDKFIKGEYSKFSLGFKDYLPRYITLEFLGDKMTGDSLQYMVTKRDQRVKMVLEEYHDISIDSDGEFWSAPDIQGRETLDIEKIKENDGHK